MNNANASKAWDIVIARKAERKDNRPAFIAALIMERTTTAQSKRAIAAGDDSEMTPSMAATFAAELVRLAVAIHREAEAACSYERTAGQEAADIRNQARFHTLAEALGFEARTGGDPRGACAYLIDPDDRKGDGWGEGWAVYA
jgi:hypothetical protein